MRKNITTILVCLPFFFAISQPSNTIPFLNKWQIKSYAKNSTKLGDIYSAIEYYEALLKYNSENYDIQYELAKLYFKSRNYSSALIYFNNVFEKARDKYPEALYYRALMKKYLGNYDEAKNDFNIFLKAIKGTELDQIYKKSVKNEIEGCDLAKKQMASPLEVFILRPDTAINKPFLENSPLSYKNGLLFTAIRTDKVLYFDKDSISALRKIYYAERKKEKWEFKGLFDENIDDTTQHVCNPALSPDKKRLYFNKCFKNWKNKYICHIYKSELQDNKWLPPVKLNGKINTDKYTSTQPTVGTSSKTNTDVLYFVSDREGSVGGYDIWFSVYNPKKADFDEPKNAGKKINTPADEITPFYDDNSRTLYFSSNGHVNIGGFDIFKAQGELNQFLPPQNIGYPINSSADDLFFSLNENEMGGFFVSNRKGTTPFLHETCCDDIFEFRWSNLIKIAVKGKIFAIKDKSLYEQLEQQDVDYGTLSALAEEIDKVSVLPNKRVDLYVVEGKERLFVKSTTTDSTGEYFFNLQPDKEYKIVVDNYGLFTKEMSVITKGITKSDTLIANAIFINLIPLEPVIIKNIYFKFNKWELTDSAKVILDNTILSLMKNNPRIIVEISAHTDSISNDEYNFKLSQKRAESVVNYLISKGIEKERLVAKGYGRTRPIAPNKNPDGTDNPEGRRKNRRVEFKIIGALEEKRNIIYEE
ncbi:MAG: OmpA family protein [Bacteroidales bacterium]|nr:OmpA family protein [Bacteroidales bacterium]